MCSRLSDTGRGASRRAAFDNKENIRPFTMSAACDCVGTSERLPSSARAFSREKDRPQRRNCVCRAKPASRLAADRDPLGDVSYVYSPGPSFKFVGGKASDSNFTVRTRMQDRAARRIERSKLNSKRCRTRL